MHDLAPWEKLEKGDVKIKFSQIFAYNIMQAYMYLHVHVLTCVITIITVIIYIVSLQN